MNTSDLVGQIYECIGDSEAFTKMLSAVVQSGKSRGAQFGLIDLTGKWIQSAVVGLDQSQLPLYVDHYAAEDPRRPYFQSHQGKWTPCQQVIGDLSAYERSTLVNEFLNKNEARFALFAAFPVEPRHSVALSLMRSRRDGRYDDEEVRLLTPLLPHLKRALSLHIRMGKLESALAPLDALVNRLPSAVLLVNRTGMLRFANSTGQEALRRAQYLVLQDGLVQPRNTLQSQQFADALQLALAHEQSTLSMEPSTSMRLFDAEGHAAVLVFQALRGQMNLSGMPRADAALFLIRSDEKPPFSASRLQVVFALTPAEARLAENLVSGESLGEIAERLKVSRETLKSQLRSLFDKTDTRRQGELIARLLGSVSIPLT